MESCFAILSLLWCFLCVETSRIEAFSAGDSLIALRIYTRLLSYLGILNHPRVSDCEISKMRDTVQLAYVFALFISILTHSLGYFGSMSARSTFYGENREIQKLSEIALVLAVDHWIVLDLLVNTWFLDGYAKPYSPSQHSTVQGDYSQVIDSVNHRISWRSQVSP